MSLNDKALKLVKPLEDGRAAQPYHAPCTTQNNVHTMKSREIKSILLISLSLVTLLSITLIIYLKSSHPLKTEGSGKSEHTANSSITPALRDILSAQLSQIHTEEYTFSEGEHLAQVLRDRYDIPDELIFDRYLSLVKKLNPEVQDLNLVKPDQKIILPSLASPTLASEEAVKPETALREEPPTELAHTEVIPVMEGAIAMRETAVAEKTPSAGNPPSREQLLKNHYNIALNFEKEEEWREAVFEYERALILNPRHIKSYNNLGRIYYRLGKFNLAVESYMQALAINPDYIKAHNNLGIALFQLGKINAAIEEFKLALTLDPDNIESYNNLGIIYKSTGKIEKARATFKRALTVDPDNAEVHYNLALLYEAENSLELAFIHYQKFVELSPPHHRELKRKVREHLFVLAKRSAQGETRKARDRHTIKKKQAFLPSFIKKLRTPK